MAITTTQLECFLEVVRQGNFSLAAATLFLSQPTLSRQIQALEEELRAQLFLRANNSVRLTELGQELRPKLEAMYQNIRTASEELHEIVDQRFGRFRLGVLATLRLDDPLHNAIMQLKKDYPASKIQLCHLDLEQSYRCLMGGTVDALLGLSAAMPQSEKLRSMALYQDEMCLAVPKEHPNAGISSLRFDQISTYFPDLEMMLLAVDSFAAPVQQELMGLRPDYTEEEHGRISGPFASLDSLLLMIDAGLGAACVNAHSILTENPRIALIPLQQQEEVVESSTLSIDLYWVDKNENPLLHSFVRQLQQEHRRPAF